MSSKTFVPSKNAQTWEMIANRLSKFSPSIALPEYVDFEVKKAIEVLDYSSEGINFVVPSFKRNDLLQTLRSAQTESGKQAFEEGRWQGALHAAKGALRDLASGVTGNAGNDSWALNISFKSTKGIGFRQIWYLELSERQLRLQNARPFRSETPELDPKFSAMFDAPNASIDLSSLHWAIGDPDPDTGRSECNVHIDQVGVNADLRGGPAITPDVTYHTLVELAFRTGLKGYLPGRVLQAVDFIMPSAHENYALNFGTQINIINREDLKLSLRGMCSVHNGGCEWSGTINLMGTHNLLGSK
jgi:hypothetical protein